MIFGSQKQRHIHAHASPNDKIPHIPCPEDAAFFRGTQSSSWVSFLRLKFAFGQFVCPGPYIPLHRLFPSKYPPPLSSWQWKPWTGWDGGARFDQDYQLARHNTQQIAASRNKKSRNHFLLHLWAWFGLIWFVLVLFWKIMNQEKKNLLERVPCSGSPCLIWYWASVVIP